MGMECGNCSMCGKTLFVKFCDNNMSAIRCVLCKASVASMAIASALRKIRPDWEDKKIYELSSRGPFFKFLHKKASNLTYSEYFNDVIPGDYKGQIQCQDVQALTYNSESFDICTSTEVFEHVPDDLNGFREIHRTLKPEGLLLFTVPLSSNKTIERARLDGGKLVYLKKPKYHNDRVLESGSVLCYRDYGLDITDRLTEAGFSRANIIQIPAPTRWGFDCSVVAAHK